MVLYSIHIISTPIGEAPLEIRRAWIGVSIPICGNSKPEPERVPAFGVVTGPRSFFGQLWALIRGRAEVNFGYLVKGADALAALEVHNPEAARWWIDECGWNPRHDLIFPVESCLLVNSASQDEDA